MSVEKNQITTKSVGVVTVLSLFFLAVLIRVFYIQFIEGDEYRLKSTLRTLKTDTIYANRGNIYANDGSLLATTVAKYTVRLDLVTIDEELFNENISALSDSLSVLFGKNSNYYLNKLTRNRNRQNRYMLLAKDLGYIDYARLLTFPIFDQGPYKGGIITEQRNVRARPLGEIAVRTVGYSDKRGDVGIEGAYIDYLKEVNGYRKKQRIAKGHWKPVNDSNELEPKDGKDIITTINVNIQDVAHHALMEQLVKYNADHGCVVVMETKTGEIRAISNLGKNVDGSYFEKRNYAVFEASEPGSTFKVASLLVGLEDKVIDTSTMVDTGSGRLVLHGRNIEDSNKAGYGTISMARVLELSSNVGVVKLIMKNYKNNPEQFVNKINSLGFGSKLGLPISGEGMPYIPNPNYVKQGDVKSWSGLSLPWMSWGYGIKVTPLQMLTFYNAIANKGTMVKPKFISAIKSHGEIEKVFETEVMNEQIASELTLNKLTKVLENVVKRGTAKAIYTPNFSMAGKTGTCQTEYWTGKTQYVSSFAGFFPVKKPKYSCIVVIHKPDKTKGYYGADVAAPVFKAIAQKVFAESMQKVTVQLKNPTITKVINQKNKYKQLANATNNKMPNVKGMPVMDAVALLENKGLKVVVRCRKFVSSQSITAGSRFVKDQKVILI